MNDEEVDIEIASHIKCKVCGESKFTLREGFYYCDECGTKQDEVRAIAVEVTEELGGEKHAKKQKIKIAKAEAPELTSWECYNYILRGLVEELLTLGAKEELKLMALQVWAAYLRRTEVAFFSRKHTVLPKMGVRFLQIDSQTLYNHRKRQKIARKRNKDGGSIRSGESSMREWRRNKRKLDESEYSIRSSNLTSRDTATNTSLNTSTSGDTTRAIQLQFSSLARKQFKKQMPIKHLEKHATDADGSLGCHKQPNVRSLNRCEHAANVLNLKQIYAILTIALNLIEDDIQLCDLLRFVDEDRLGINNLMQYFPENLAPHSKQMLKDIGFYACPTKYTYKNMTEQVYVLSRLIHISEFKRPDIAKLVHRYVTELNLPKEVVTYAERLINLLAPKMQTRSHSYGAYEARAMAYIIFVMKLCFGLDGHKEQLMSEAAQQINEKLQQMKNSEDLGKKQPPPPLLFVWNEWLEYIEMRKVIVSQYNQSFCRRFNQCQSTAQLVAEIREDQQHQQEEANTTAAEGDAKKRKQETNSSVDNMKRILDNFLQNYTKQPAEKVDLITFSPSYTPAHDYFKRIQLYVASAEHNKTSTITLPEFMRIDHTQRSIDNYLSPKSMRQYFATHGQKLKIKKIPCTSARCFTGIFRPPPLVVDRPLLLPADFAVSEQEWLKEIGDEPPIDELEFKTKLSSYNPAYFERMTRKRKHWLVSDDSDEDTAPQWVQVGGNVKTPAQKSQLNANDFLLSSVKFKNLLSQRNIRNEDIMSLPSFDVFNECDMEPIANLNLKAPRRRYDGVQLFDDLSSDDESCAEEVESMAESSIISRPIFATQSDQTLKKELQDYAAQPNVHTLLTSTMDCWMQLGPIASLNWVQKKIVEHKFPRSFFWLLETCAQTLGIEWSLIYEQLLVIEVMFGFGVESLDELHDCVRFRQHIDIKEINTFLIQLKDAW